MIASRFYIDFTLANRIPSEKMQSHHLLQVTNIYAMLVTIIPPPVLSKLPCFHLNPLSGCPESRGTNCGGILLLDFMWIDQTTIIKVLLKHARLRDIHRAFVKNEMDNQVLVISPIVVFANLVAEAHNMTLVSTTGIPISCFIKSSNPILSFYVEAQNLRNKIFKLHSNHISLSYGLLPLIDHASNFFYCGTRKRQENLFPLAIFKNTADKFVWTCLGISLLTTAIMVKANFSGKSSSAFVLLRTLSAILCSGTSSVRPNSKLFQLWMFVSLIFVTFYSGCLTSAVTSPEPVERLKHIKDLLEANYSLIFSNQVERNGTKDRLREHMNWASQQNNVKILGKLRQLEQLIDSSVANSLDKFSDFSWHEKFRDGENVAFFAHFSYVIQQATRLITSLEERNNKKVGCYVGQELHLKEMMYIFTDNAG